MKIIRQASKAGHFLMTRPSPIIVHVRLESKLALVISIFLFKKDFYAMELKYYFDNLLEYRKRFIIRMITNWIKLDNSNACKKNTRDKTNYSLNWNSTCVPLVLQLHEDYHSLIRISQESTIRWSISRSQINYYL